MIAEEFKMARALQHFCHADDKEILKEFFATALEATKRGDISPEDAAKFAMAGINHITVDLVMESLSTIQKIASKLDPVLAEEVYDDVRDSIIPPGGVSAYRAEGMLTLQTLAVAHPSLVKAYRTNFIQFLTCEENVEDLNQVMSKFHSLIRKYPDQNFAPIVGVLSQFLSHTDKSVRSNAHGVILMASLKNEQTRKSIAGIIRKDMAPLDELDENRRVVLYEMGAIIFRSDEQDLFDVGKLYEMAQEDLHSYTTEPLCMNAALTFISKTWPLQVGVTIKNERTFLRGLAVHGISFGLDATVSFVKKNIFPADSLSSYLSHYIGRGIPQTDEEENIKLDILLLLLNRKQKNVIGLNAIRYAAWLCKDSDLSKEVQEKADAFLSECFAEPRGQDLGLRIASSNRATVKVRRTILSVLERKALDPDRREKMKAAWDKLKTPADRSVAMWTQVLRGKLAPRMSI